jgi:hypothetical protein
MKARIRRRQFVVVALFTLLACTTSLAEAQSMRMHNVAPVHIAPMPMQMRNVAQAHVVPMPVHLAMSPAPMTVKTMSPSTAAKTPSSVTTPNTTQSHMNTLTQSQRHTLREERRLVAGEDLFLLARLASGINGTSPYGTYPYVPAVNPYASAVNPYVTAANPYAPTTNPYTSMTAPAYSSGGSGGYGAGNSYPSAYFINPYAPSGSSPYSPSLKPTGGYADTPAPLPAQDSKTQQRDVLGVREVSTLLTGLGVPNVKGQVIWPTGLETLRPTSESHALRQQVSVDFRILLSQMLAGAENATFANQGHIALARLDVLLRDNEKSMAPAVSAEAKQFLAKLQQALEVLRP